MSLCITEKNANAGLAAGHVGLPVKHVQLRISTVDKPLRPRPLQRSLNQDLVESRPQHSEPS